MAKCIYNIYAVNPFHDTNVLIILNPKLLPWLTPVLLYYRVKRTRYIS